MILIADSGSTKTDWRLVNDNKVILQIATQGINPYFTDEEGIVEMLSNEFPDENISEINKTTSSIFFYGSGCANAEKSGIVANGLKRLFANAVIEVQSDMLGVARSLCGNSEGIATILGTGANTCYYNGKECICRTPSLGYILGDEGSGAHIGKTFIQALLNGEMPESIVANFQKRFALDKDTILDILYRKPFPNRFLASFSKFVYQNLKEPTLETLVINCFRQYFERHICKYPNYKKIPLNFSGSIAFYFSNLLRGVAAEKGARISTIVESPIAALTLYHLGE
jgi:N-acetylglucosamine kinase-like BadF-type ATPase